MTQSLRQNRETGLRHFIADSVTVGRVGNGTDLIFQHASVGRKASDPLTLVCTDAAGLTVLYHVTVTEVVKS